MNLVPLLVWGDKFVLFFIQVLKAIYLLKLLLLFNEKGISDVTTEGVPWNYYLESSLIKSTLLMGASLLNSVAYLID